MVVISGLAVTATVIVVTPFAEVPEEPELEHAAAASELTATTESSAIPLRLLRRIGIVPP
jgi:hypothetical protein